MLTKNFKICDISTFISTSGQPKALVNEEGNTITLSGYTYRHSDVFVTNLYSGNYSQAKATTSFPTCVAFGSGEITPTADDFKLDTYVDNSLFTHLSHSYANNTSTEGVNNTHTITYSFQYTGTTDIFVGEVGLFFKQGQSSNTPMFMLAHEDIRTTDENGVKHLIKIEPNTTFSVTMVIG